MSLRFWAAMAAAPAAFASAASCGGGATPDARPPAEPQTDLVVGKSEGTPIEVSDLDASAVDAGPRRRKPHCAVDQYPLAQCLDLKTNECPETPPPTRALKSPFGGRVNARLDPEWTATAYKGTCCFDWCETIATTTTANTTCQPNQVRRTECIPAPEKGTAVPAPAPHDRCPVGVVFSEVASAAGRFEGSFDPGVTDARMRAPDAGAMCCYGTCGPRTSLVIKGRAARHEGDVVVAPQGAGDPSRAWCEGGRVVPGLTLDDAFYEHASVASFARLSLSMLAFGAPPDLVADAHRAALDEIRHARIAFASAGESIGPGPCPAFAELRAHRTLADLAEESFLDGCIGETLASLELRDAAPDMAAEEARHADLAWRIVEWALASGDAAVRERIERAVRAVPCAGDASARWANANVIAPCTEALLS